MLRLVITIVAVAVLPLVLAGYSGHLATLALPEAKARRTALFIVWALAVLGIVVFGISQVIDHRADKLHDESNDKFEADVRRDLQRIKNEPDPVERRQLASALEQVTTAQSRAEKASQASAESRKPYPQNLSNRQLCDAADKLADQIRTFKEGYDIMTRRFADEWQKNVGETIYSKSLSADEKKTNQDRLFQSLHANEMKLEMDQDSEYDARFESEAELLRDEVLNRLPREERFSERSIRANPSFAGGSLGWWRQPTAQDELNRLSGMLCGSSKPQ